MSECYVGEIRPVPFTFAPVGWLVCDGSLLPISQYEVLYTLIGTTYGGDGTTNFALPDLRSRIPVGTGTPNGRPPYVIGQQGGAETVSITGQTMPIHTHSVNVSNLAASSADPTNGVPALASSQVYAVPNGAVMNGAAVVPNPPGNPHENLQPYLGITYIIAYNGIFPSQG